MGGRIVASAVTALAGALKVESLETTGMLIGGAVEFLNGVTILSGAGAPSLAAPNGSLYLRTDGTAITTLYVRAAGTWVPK